MSPASYETVETDVLVLGAGGAGLRGAIAAAESGARVLVVCKSLLGKAHTVMAEGGVAAALHNVAYQDTWEVHFADTMKGGKLINDWRMAEIHAKESPERVLELERWGAVFDRTWQGRIHQRPFGAHTYPRLAHIGDRTGLELLRTLQDRAVHTNGVDVHMEVTVFKLLKTDGRITGALAYRRSDGSLILYRCAALLLASGGAGKMYRVTSNSWESTGDGAMLAFDAGAELQDMEMVQFHPTGMIWPPGVRGILVTEGVRGEGGILRNGKGERFMFDPKYTPPAYRGRYAETEEEAHRWLEDKDNNRPPPELLPRDVTSRAIYREVLAGNGTEHGGAYLDVTQRGADFVKRKLPSMYEQFRALGDVDITREPMEVGPTIHYTMGGVRAEPETGATTRAGLFAAGEVACGVHGANRLGGNALCDILVFGKRAGEAAARCAQSTAHGAIDEATVREEAESLLAPFESPGTENPYLLTQELQAVMQEGAMIARTEEDLSKRLDRVLGLQERAKNLHVEGSRLYNPGWHTARDIRVMLKLSEIIVRCALERRESRGAQWRTDYPDPDPEWAKRNLIATRDGEGIRITTRPVPELPPELAALFKD